jgi:hypothetical protein
LLFASFSPAVLAASSDPNHSVRTVPGDPIRPYMATTASLHQTNRAALAEVDGFLRGLILLRGNGAYPKRSTRHASPPQVGAPSTDIRRLCSSGLLSAGRMVAKPAKQPIRDPFDLQSEQSAAAKRE